MQFPSTPPPLQRTLLEDRETLFNILGKTTEEATRTDRYLHWDELKHRTPPAGLSKEEWWLGLKFSRISRQQPIPLQDKGGKPFVFNLTPGMFEKLHDIDLKCGGTVEGPEPVTNPDTRDRYYVSSLVEEAITSSQLEGAAVTRAVAKEMIRTQRKPLDDDERMILNNFRTMRELSKWKETDLSPELIMEIHRTITSGTLEAREQEGRLRTAKEPVRVEDEESGEVVHTPPNADELPKRLKIFCEFANDTEMRGFLHPVIRSIILHFWIAYEHPFVDGNGRTARALFYWSMLRNGFWLFEFISISQQILRAPKKYYRAFLYTETDENDLNYFLLHQLGVIQNAIGDLHNYIHRKAGELEEMQNLLGGIREFNHRQLSLLKYAMRHPNARFTVASHQNSHGVVTNTARTDLEKLREWGLLNRKKYSKAHVYQPPRDLPAKLTSLRDEDLQPNAHSGYPVSDQAR